MKRNLCIDPKVLLFQPEYNHSGTLCLDRVKAKKKGLETYPTLSF